MLLFCCLRCCNSEWHSNAAIGLAVATFGVSFLVGSCGEHCQLVHRRTTPEVRGNAVPIGNVPHMWMGRVGHIAVGTALPRPCGMARCWWLGSWDGSSWDVIAEREGSRAIDQISHVERQNCVHLYIPVVNKCLSIEVPYTGHFWQRNATNSNKHDSTGEHCDETKASSQEFNFFLEHSLVILLLLCWDCFHSHVLVTNWCWWKWRYSEFARTTYRIKN